MERFDQRFKVQFKKVTKLHLKLRIAYTLGVYCLIKYNSTILLLFNVEVGYEETQLYFKDAVVTNHFKKLFT